MSSLTSSPPTVGSTVSVRARTPVGPVTVVGVVVAADDVTWSLRRRDGGIFTVATSDIDARREVPPPPSRQIAVDDLARIAALGWRPLVGDSLGDWQLRAAGGFTGRANSALVVGSPGVPLADALDRVQDWYAALGLPARLQVPAGAGDLTAALDAAGWSLDSSPVVVMTAELSHVLRAGEDPNAPAVDLADAPDTAWLSTYRDGEGAASETARAVLTNHPQAIFAAVRRAEEALAIARVSIDGKWAGVFGVEVRPDARRGGLGTAVTVGALREAGRRGARRVYLQVFSENAPAIALYERLNFSRHHTYRYATPAGPTP